MASQEQEILIRMQQRAAEAAKYAQLDYSEASIFRVERTLDEIRMHIGAKVCWRRLGGRAWTTLSISLREDSNSLICCLPTAKKRSAPSRGLCISLTRDTSERKRGLTGATNT